MINLKQYLRRDGTTDEQRPVHDGAARDDVERLARYMAEQICSGFQLHDRGQRDEAVEAFYAVDRNQFDRAKPDEALRAAEAFVDALWAKDALEKRHLVGGVIDSESVGEGDWGTVQEPLERRAEAVGIDAAYAHHTTEAWRKHKTGEEYWTDFLAAQTHELRAATGDATYPDKPKEGQSGYGPTATRYVLAVELHDMHTRDTWEEAIRVMVPYYTTVLRAHRNGGVA